MWVPLAFNHNASQSARECMKLTLITTSVYVDSEQISIYHPHKHTHTRTQVEQVNTMKDTVQQQWSQNPMVGRLKWGWHKRVKTKISVYTSDGQVDYSSGCLSGAHQKTLTLHVIMISIVDRRQHIYSPFAWLCDDGQHTLQVVVYNAAPKKHWRAGRAGGVREAREVLFIESRLAASLAECVDGCWLYCHSTS